VIIVASAMGKSTDLLVKMAVEANAQPPKREMDALLSTGERVTVALMAMTLEALGSPAVSFAARQVGIKTDADFTRARITAIDTAVLMQHLEVGEICVVAGFQGVSPTGDITTLGRGGSDTTAVALAAALGAESCEIYTDVDGVYTADPRDVPNARKLSHITYEEMLELAALGAGVLHPRAVQFGAKYNVPIHVRHAHLPDAGTMITDKKEADPMEEVQVAGVALKENLGRISLQSIPDVPGVASRIFAALAESGVVVDDIIQTEGDDKLATISFTVDHADLADIKPVIANILADIGGGTERIDTGFAKVSVVGVGIRSHAALAALLFRTLADAQINIANITTSEIKVCAIIAQSDAKNAVKLVHDAFDLDKN
jgi:aspartate kinase